MVRHTDADAHGASGDMPTITISTIGSTMRKNSAVLSRSTRRPREGERARPRTARDASAATARTIRVKAPMARTGSTIVARPPPGVARPVTARGVLPFGVDSARRLMSAGALEMKEKLPPSNASSKTTIAAMPSA